MKINKIKKPIIKRSWLVIAEDENGAQWVGDARALYSLDGLPHMHDGQICRVLGITNEEAAGLEEIKHYDEAAWLARYKDVNVPAETVKDMDDEITINGNTYRAVTDTNGRTVFFNPEYIAPVAKADIFTLAPDDNLLAFEGLFLVAIICPVKPGPETANRIFELYSAMK